HSAAIRPPRATGARLRRPGLHAFIWAPSLASIRTLGEAQLLACTHCLVHPDHSSLRGKLFSDLAGVSAPPQFSADDRDCRSRVPSVLYCDCLGAKLGARTAGLCARLPRPSRATSLCEWPRPWTAGVQTIAGDCRSRGLRLLGGVEPGGGRAAVGCSPGRNRLAALRHGSHEAICECDVEDSPAVCAGGTENLLGPFAASVLDHDRA